MIDGSYCKNNCEIGKAKLEEILSQSISVFDAVSMWNDFILNCDKPCLENLDK